MNSNPIALTAPIVPAEFIPVKKARKDGQMSGLAGELFVAAELLTRDIQASVTLGNAKSIDLLAHNIATNKQFAVQVKALRKTNWFLISKKSIKAEQIYVFVLLNAPGVAPEYFIVEGENLVSEECFQKGLADPSMPGVRPKELEPYRENWTIFTAP